MAGGQEKWYFTKEQLQNSPSRKCCLDADKELAYRQQAANLIQDMGQRLQVSQLCINTAIVYMHRFYAFHSFTQFHRNAIAAAALFLAAKVEEQPRKLEYVIKVAHVCLHRGEGVNALTSEQYQEQAQDLVFNENVLLQTLGFDVAIDHPHTHVVRTCHLVKAPKDLAQTSYFMASNSLHLTTMCLQYRPTVVACFCIHLASKWSNWAIPQSHEGRHWFSYVDRSVTTELLERLTAEFLHIFDKCPSRLKRKMMTMSNSGSSPHSNAHPSGSGVANSPFDKKHSLVNSDEIDKSFDKEYERERRRQLPPAPGGYVPATTAQPAPQPQKIDYNLYREKREREERERREERDRRQQNANARGRQIPPGPSGFDPAATSQPAAQPLQREAGETGERRQQSANARGRQIPPGPSGFDPAATTHPATTVQPATQPPQPQQREKGEPGERRQQNANARGRQPGPSVFDPAATSQPAAQPPQREAGESGERRQQNANARGRQVQPGPSVFDPAATSQPAAQPPQREAGESGERRQQALQRPIGVAQPNTRPNHPPPHHRPASSQHHKPHHPWPHKPPHHKPPHDHRHHRQMPGPSTSGPHPPTEVPQNVPQRTRPPSLFSPENASTPSASAAAASAPRRPNPPQPQRPIPRPEQRPQNSNTPIQQAQPNIPEQKPPSPHKKRPDPTAVVRDMQPPAILSPFSSPPNKMVDKRQRLPSNSEPELVPVVKKIDETPGYENVIRDSQRGNAIKTRPPERKPESSRPLNGIETDPTLVSNLLKESLAKPAPITVPVEKKSPIEIKKEPIVEPPLQPVVPQVVPPMAPPPQFEPPPNMNPLPQTQNPPQNQNQTQSEEPEHKHKKEKKKKDKHKHKDRDKSKEERKKHKKDKDKDKEKKEKEQPAPPVPETDGIRITIPRDKLSASPGLKIKIPKERLAAPPPPPNAGLKIKISKEVLETSRKRTGVNEPGPPQKMARHEAPPVNKVGWNIPFRPPLPYFMVQPPPPLYYGMGMDGYFYGMFPPPQQRPRQQPPLPAMPPPPVPPPPPE
ncbi:cyclin-T2 isoform X3 [Maniola jurtina]|uniref:cyclin-T2 isoform X3 n=1 Tax=Maniola jurtina TaxID=191418 RepID=UPI001E68A968|nr:cyclin-T2 isoform X3 [Maniola jurtina]